MGMAAASREREEQERQLEENRREKAKWARLSSEPPPLPQLQPRQRDLVGPIVIGGLVEVAFVLFMGWYSKSTQTATVETTSSIARPQSTVMEGLTPQQIEMLKARRDAVALPVSQPTPKKKKRAE